MVCVRFAPSPTGYLHIGNAWSALINYLYALRSGGEFILRIDDTDLERSKTEYEKAIFDDLSWLVIKDNQTFHQSARFDRYKEISKQIRKIFLDYTDLVEPLSLDEAYLDVTENKKGNPSATLIAQEIRKRIFEELGLTASAGISINKFVVDASCGRPI